MLPVYYDNDNNMNRDGNSNSIDNYKNHIDDADDQVWSRVIN